MKVFFAAIGVAFSLGFCALASELPPLHAAALLSMLTFLFGLMGGLDLLLPKVVGTALGVYAAATLCAGSGAFLTVLGIVIGNELGSIVAAKLWTVGRKAFKAA